LKAVGSLQQKFEKLVSDGELVPGAAYDIVDNAMYAIDPNGTSDFGTYQALFDRLTSLLMKTEGVEIIYPKPGDEYSAQEFELGGVTRGTGISEKWVVKVMNPGYKKDGKVL